MAREKGRVDQKRNSITNKADSWSKKGANQGIRQYLGKRLPSLQVSSHLSMHAQTRIRSLIEIQHSDKIIGFGKLRVEGTLEGVELEIWGNLIIIGLL